MDVSNSATENAESPQKKGKTVWIIVLVVLAVLLCACLAVIAVLAILGPAVGNVFSNIILTVEPVP